MKHQIKKNQIAAFIMLSYFLSWICWIPIIDLIEADLYSSPIAVIFLLLLGGYSPTLSAIIISGITGGKKSIIELFNKFRILRVGFKWYAVALLTGPVFIFIAILFYTSLGGELGWVNYQVFLFLPVFFLVASVFGPMAEELGWRGYLLPRVNEYGFLKASLFIGLIWTFWHAPLFWASEGTSISGMPVTFISVAKYLTFITGTCIIYTWVFRNTKGSVFMTLLIHMSVNGSNIAMSYLLPNIEDKRAIWNIEVWLFGFLLILVAVFVLVKKLKKSNQLT